MPRPKPPQRTRAPVKPVAPVPTTSRPAPARPTRPPTPSVPDGASIASLVDDACNFILERKQTHAASIAWEVGEYLFEHTFRGDLDYLQSKDRNKPDSLKEIAERTGIHRVRLASWVRAYVARKYLEPAGIHPDLSMTEFEALRPLVPYPHAARAALELRDHFQLTINQLDTLAVSWKRRLDEGERLQDILALPLPPNVRPRRKRGHRHRPSRRPDLTIPRLFKLVSRWLERVTLAPPLRAEIDFRLRDLHRRFAAAQSNPASMARSASQSAPAAIPSALPSPIVSLAPVASATLDQTALVRDAVGFIERTLREHTLAFALEVGRYLFERVYGSDRELFYYGGHPWQTDTIRRIAGDPRVGLQPQFLYRAIHAYLARRRAAAALPPGEDLPDLPVSVWNALWPIESDETSLLPVVRWAATNRVPVREVADTAALVQPYLAAGGRLEDLLPTPSQERNTPYRRLTRILDVLDSLLPPPP